MLCLLEGHSKADAARTLGWPEGTLSCRLQRARERLRARLAARGLTLSAGALAAALFEGAGAAAVPDWLIESTLRGVWTPAAAARARALADGVTQAMFLTKVKMVAAAVLVVGVVGTGTGVAIVPGAGPGPVMGDEPAKDARQRPLPRPFRADPRTLFKDADLARINLQVVAQLDADDKAAKAEAATGPPAGPADATATRSGRRPSGCGRSSTRGPYPATSGTGCRRTSSRPRPP